MVHTAVSRVNHLYVPIPLLHGQRPSIVPGHPADPGCGSSASLVAALFAAGHDERALYFVVFVTAVFTMSNRIVHGLGLATPSPAGLYEAVERLHRQGYAGTVQYIMAQADPGQGRTFLPRRAGNFLPS